VQIFEWAGREFARGNHVPFFVVLVAMVVLIGLLGALLESGVRRLNRWAETPPTRKRQDERPPR
jgi:hypothetical protein